MLPTLVPNIKKTKLIETYFGNVKRGVISVIIGSGTYWKAVTFGPYTGGRPSNVTTRVSSFDIDLRLLVVFLNCDVVHVIIVLVTLYKY